MVFGFLWLFDLFKHQAVVLFEEFLLVDELESIADNFFHENFLPRSDMVQHPFPARAFNPVKVDHHHLSSRTQRPVNRGHGLVRIFEVMIGVADEGEVN